jgi:hypothetical protein
MLTVDRAPSITPTLPDEHEAFRLALVSFVNAFARRHLRGRTLGEAALMLQVATDLLEREAAR